MAVNCVLYSDIGDVPERLPEEDPAQILQQLIYREISHVT